MRIVSKVKGHSFRFSGIENSQNSIKFYPVLFSDIYKPDKLFVNIRTRSKQCVGLARKSFLFEKIMMPLNKRFTNRVTRSVLEIRNPHFYARPWQARAVQKR